MPPDNQDAFALLSQLTDQYLDRDLEREEVIQIRDAVNQHLLPLMEHPKKILVLGSYDEGEKEVLKQVKATLGSMSRLNNSSEVKVFMMDDIPGDDIWINLDIKFRLLADIADDIVGVAEHDRGGFMFEQGVLATEIEYRRKTIILKREYATRKDEHDHYSAMQSTGLFTELKDRNRLFLWRNAGELIEATGEAYQLIVSED